MTKSLLEEIFDAIFIRKRREVVHRGYSVRERQLGTIYEGWRIVARRKIPRWRRWLHNGKSWEFLGVNDGIRYNYKKRR